MEVNVKVEEKAIIGRLEKNELYSSKIYNQLKHLIISGQLKPGALVNERECSALLDVSRTPVRDAFRILEREGWVENYGKNRRIAPLRWRDILDLIEIREPLDWLLFELAFPKVTQIHIQEMRDIIGEMKHLTDQDKEYYHAMKLDTDFHSYFAHVSGNRILIDIQNTMSEKIVRSSVLCMQISQYSASQFADEHFEIIDSLEQKNLEKCRELLREHYDNWKGRLLKIPELLKFDPSLTEMEIAEEFDNRETIKFDKLNKI
jgi:DNA-binding GntR family transcriptional regulator